jgi:hypothetical protein
MNSPKYELHIFIAKMFLKLWDPMKVGFEPLCQVQTINKLN